MILVDANLLLFAYDASSEQHVPARRWVERVFSAPEAVLLSWVTILAFLRIGTNPRAFRRPFTLEEAVEIVSQWLSRPNVRLAEPGGRHWEILSRLLPATQAKADLVMDAHLVALALEYDATLYSHDRDFSRFPGLRFEDPLRPA